MKRRGLLQAGAGSLVLVLGRQQIAFGATLVAVRIWPSNDYTRITLESDTVLQAKLSQAGNPPRLSIDIEGLQLGSNLAELNAKVNADDPYIRQIRVSQYLQNTVRLALDLKQDVAAQVFGLKPVATYQNRLVFDIYPAKATDMLDALIQEQISAKPAENHITTDPLDEIAGGLARSRKRAATNTLPPTTRERILSVFGLAPAAASAAKSATKAPDPNIDIIGAVGRRGANTSTDGGADTSLQGTMQNMANRLIIIALDPGHGGEDPGAIGPAGTREKDVVLNVALKLRERINSTSVNGNPMRVFMTRDSDYFVPLHERVNKARKVQADLFISIHADAFTTPAAKGASVFALSSHGASSAAARWMAAKENQADAVGGVNTSNKDRSVLKVLLDMSTSAQIKDSLNLAGTILRRIGNIAALHKGSVEQAGFAVLKAPDIPSILVETAFISNPDEEARLNQEDYQNQLADAMMNGIEAYFAKNPPLARTRRRT